MNQSLVRPGIFRWFLERNVVPRKEKANVLNYYFIDTKTFLYDK